MENKNLDYWPKNLLKQEKTDALSSDMREAVEAARTFVSAMRQAPTSIRQMGFATLDRIMATLALRHMNPGKKKSLLVIGSARTKEGTPAYDEIVEGVHDIVRNCIATVILQGACGGSMRAAGQGSRRAGGTSIGFAMENDTYVDPSKGFDEAGWGIHEFNDAIVRFADYDTRKHVMLETADAVMVSSALGGGTLDEFTDQFVSNQYGTPKPLIVYGDNPTGKHLHAFLSTMASEGWISAKDAPSTDGKNKGPAFFTTEQKVQMLNHLSHSLSS